MKKFPKSFYGVIPIMIYNIVLGSYLSITMIREEGVTTFGNIIGWFLVVALLAMIIGFVLAVKNAMSSDSAKPNDPSGEE